MLLVHDALGCLSSNLTVVAHWIFAITYFELALKCKLFIGEYDFERIEQQLKAKDRQILVGNVIFYAYSLLLTSLWLFVPEFISIWFTMQLLGALAAAIILVFSL